MTSGYLLYHKSPPQCLVMCSTWGVLRGRRSCIKTLRLCPLPSLLVFLKVSDMKCAESCIETFVYICGSHIEWKREAAVPSHQKSRL